MKDEEETEEFVDRPSDELSDEALDRAQADITFMTWGKGCVDVR